MYEYNIIFSCHYRLNMWITFYKIVPTMCKQINDYDSDSDWLDIDCPSLKFTNSLAIRSSNTKLKQWNKYKTTKRHVDDNFLSAREYVWAQPPNEYHFHFAAKKYAVEYRGVICSAISEIPSRGDMKGRECVRK